MRTFAGVSLAVLLAYACVRSTAVRHRPVRDRAAPRPRCKVPWFYPVVSMAVGYYFITLHYLVGGGGRGGAPGRRPARPAFRDAALALVGGLVIGAAVWGLASLLLEVGASQLLALGVIFVALTLAGMPIIFMLSIVGIIAFLPSFLGLSFYPTPDPLVPFSTTQSTMGLTGGDELIVIRCSWSRPRSSTPAACRRA